MNPLAPAAHDRVAHPIHADVSVVVAAHREDRRDLAERADQIAQLAQLRRPIDQVAPQEQGIDFGGARGFDHLPAEVIGAVPPKVDVAHVHQAARIRPDRQALLADVKGPVQPDGQRSRRQVGSPYSGVALARLVAAFAHQTQPGCSPGGACQARGPIEAVTAETRQPPAGRPRPSEEHRGAAPSTLYGKATESVHRTGSERVVQVRRDGQGRPHARSRWTPATPTSPSLTLPRCEGARETNPGGPGRGGVSDGDRRGASRLVRGEAEGPSAEPCARGDGTAAEEWPRGSPATWAPTQWTPVPCGSPGTRSRSRWSSRDSRTTAARSWPIGPSGSGSRDDAGPLAIDRRQRGVRSRSLSSVCAAGCASVARNLPPASFPSAPR